MSDTVPNVFFREQRSFAAIKQELLVSYFEAWCRIRLATRAIGSEEPLVVVDLNAVAGQEQLAQQSEDFEVLRNLLRSTGKRQGLQESVQFFLHDPVKAGIAEISRQLEQQTAYEALVHKPLYLHEAANRPLLEEALAAGSPSFMFLNPFSYGYAQEMLLNACNTWRTDLLMLFCPDSIRKAITGKKVSLPLTELFGNRLPLISAFCRKEKDNVRRTAFILQHLHCLLREKGLFTLLYRINLPDSDTASHFLLFCSPDTAAYNCFKHLMLPYSAYQQDGVPLFVSDQGPQHQLALFPSRPKYTVEHLVEDLATGAAQFRFKSIEKICDLHSHNTPYIRENYLAAFEHLRDQQKVVLLNGKTMQTIRKAAYTSVVKYLL